MSLMHTAARAFAALVLCLAVGSSKAAEPLADSPGWYRMTLGRFTVTALWDGTLDMPVDQVFARPGAQRLKALLARAYLSPTVPLSVNAFVVDTGQRVVMIDTGTGASRMFGNGLGKVQAQLRASGYTPEQIDEIYITHMHTDHVGGLTVDGRAVYPRAVVRADAREAGHYLSPQKRAAASDDKEDFDSAIAMLEPYVQSGRWRPFDGGTELVAGVRALPAPGHTPGHTAYVVESDDEKLILWGDLMHVAAVQFPLPSATVSFDAVQSQSAAHRARIFREAARDGAWIAAAHVGFPGIGKLRAEAVGGYGWIPISMVRGR
ncbi:MBL fold metallo-hydrolase [Piscinibacter sp. XHJ-5]|uniref:MBL fold metallo-hydrolase n=1 Tax=Piscinibacter sp. XHJ-5 TaxID=3037797 RepID=UPI0024532DEE|nr:MBL fold metallo-hydrolase [Piscinibacter sp. XHJ-5]